MKKALIIIALVPLVLTSCMDKPKEVKNTEVSSGEISEETENIATVSLVQKEIVGTGDTVGVDYVGTLEDGTIFDASIEEFAKKSTNYSPGRTYEPLSFTVGAGQMIKGFDAGVIGMKLGEKKTLVLAPADAYGEAYKEQEVPAKYLQDVFTETVPRENFKDTITQVVSMSELGEKGANLTVGGTIDAGNTKATVTKIDGDNVTIDIENTQNPFYGKKMKVGLKATFEGNTVTVKKLTDTEITLEIVNKASPFYGKKLKEGMEGTTTDGGKIKIIAITKEIITIGVPNPNPLAGKTLKFDVEIKSIK